MTISEKQRKNDLDNLALAQFWAMRKSKDPSTQLSAIITDRFNRVVGMGYNGFARGVEDTQERLQDRTTKYAMIVHAEPNAILIAGDRCIGGTIYTWPLMTCSNCAALVINSGISRVVSVMDKEREDRWDCDLSKIMFEEAGIDLCLYGTNDIE